MTTTKSPTGTLAELNTVEDQILAIYHASSRQPINRDQLRALRERQADLTARRRREYAATHQPRLADDAWSMARS